MWFPVRQGLDVTKSPSTDFSSTSISDFVNVSVGSFDITITSWWARWRRISPVRPFAQSFVQAQIKESTKASRHWPLRGESTSDRWIPLTKGQQRGKCFHLITSLWVTFIFARCQHSNKTPWRRKQPASRLLFCQQLIPASNKESIKAPPFVRGTKKLVTGDSHSQMANYMLYHDYWRHLPYISPFAFQQLCRRRQPGWPANKNHI